MCRPCPECGGRTDWPGLFGCDDPPHPAPTLAQQIARDIEHDVRGRRGLKWEWERIDDDTQYDIREAWVRLIEQRLPPVAA